MSSSSSPQKQQPSSNQNLSSQPDYYNTNVINQSKGNDMEVDGEEEENATCERSTLINQDDDAMVVIVSHGGSGEKNVILDRSGGEGGTSHLFSYQNRNLASLLQVQPQYYADVCRICHCGPNTLATPTPTVLTPVTSPKKLIFHQNATEGVNQSPSAVSIQLKRTPQSTSPPRTQSPQQSSPPPQIIFPTPPPPSGSPTPSLSPYKKKKQNAPPPSTPDYNLISPCICSGSLKYVHQCCLQHWIRASNNTACELCKHPYDLRSRFKPIWKWESLPMSHREKRRVICSSLFHTVALACVIWSLYVLIDRTVEELTHSDLEWQFWTKIIVEAIGCLGAGILTYVWGKSYVSLFVKWISFNRSFVILGKEHRNSIPEQMQPQSPPPPPQPETQTQQLKEPQEQIPGTSAAAGQSSSSSSPVKTELIKLIN